MREDLGQQSLTLKTIILASTRSAPQLFWVLSVRSLVTEGIELLAMNGISAANLSESLVQEMQRTGFRALNLALVTSDKQRQRATKRPGSTPHFDRVVQKGAEVGIEMVNYLILGLPDSSIEEMLSSIIHLMERPVLIGPSVFYATPGTESYRECLERGLLTSPELALQRSTCFPGRDTTLYAP